jgi:hypothetical protein
MMSLRVFEKQSPTDAGIAHLYSLASPVICSPALRAGASVANQAGVRAGASVQGR